MPVPTANVSGDINAAIGEVSTLRVTAVYSDPVWADETNNAVIVGGGLIPVTADGLIDVNLPQTNDTVRVAINVEYVDNATRQRKSATSGWQELTTDVDFATFMAMTPTSVPQSTAESLAARIDGYTDHGDVSGTLAVDPATGTHVLNATDALLVTLAAETDGRIVTLYVIGGAENVTIDGIADLELTDGAFASFVRIRGAWVLASAGAGGGTPATPDTTPPTAVTNLNATGAAGQVSATWTAATDTESSVSYRWRVWLTSGGATGTWTTTAGTSFTKTGLASGAYTVEVYAYSNGGASATATDTATVPESVENITDDFTTADTTSINGRATPGGNKAWVTPWQTGIGADVIGVSSNRAYRTGGDSGGGARVLPAAQNFVVSCTYDVTATSSQVRVLARANPTNAGAPTTAGICAYVRNDGSVRVDRGEDYSLGTIGSGAPTTGTIALEVNGNTGRVLIDDVQVGASFSVEQALGTYAGIALYMSGYADNFQVEYL